ncbi:hypothetical protein C7417_5621 [Cupriavidus plantarum]|nr:hypothetical protein C7417_5621 [Cupriavidus plantarum]
MYQPPGRIRRLTQSPRCRYGRDTSVNFNGIHGDDIPTRRPNRSTAYQKEPIMNANFAKQVLLAVALAASAVAAQAAVSSPRDPYTDGARSVQDQRSPYYDGARTVSEPRSPYSDGARNVEPYFDGARAAFVAGRDRTGVSAEPGRSVDPYLDGAYA